MSFEELNDVVTVLFVANNQPDIEALKKCRPFLVRRERVVRVLRWLIYDSGDFSDGRQRKVQDKGTHRTSDSGDHRLGVGEPSERCESLRQVHRGLRAER